MLLAILALPLLSSISHAQTTYDVFSHPTLEIALAGLGVDLKTFEQKAPCIAGEEIELDTIQTPHFRVRFRTDEYNADSIIFTIEGTQAFKTYSAPAPYQVLEFQTTYGPQDFLEKCGTAFVSERTEGAHAAYEYHLQKSKFMASPLAKSAFETDDPKLFAAQIDPLIKAMLKNSPETETQSFDGSPFLMDYHSPNNLYPTGADLVQNLQNYFDHSRGSDLLQALEVTLMPYPEITYPPATN